MRGFLGWDVGAWHCQGGASRDALVLLTDEGGSLRAIGKPWRGNLRAAYNGGDGWDLLGELLRLVVAAEHRWNQITLAIDAPLGWPTAFRELLDDVHPAAIATQKAQNPLLMRETERWLCARGHRPLSAVQDLIGSQATKGMAFLGALGLAAVGTGIWAARIGETEVTAIEVYPAPCKHSQTIKSVRANLQSALPSDANSDLQDAQTCAILGAIYTLRPECLAPPAPAIDSREGWIWVPRDCLADKEPAE